VIHNALEKGLRQGKGLLSKVMVFFGSRHIIILDGFVKSPDACPWQNVTAPKTAGVSYRISALNILNFSEKVKRFPPALLSIDLWNYICCAILPLKGRTVPQGQLKG
jgi:hypothetical protein